MVTCPLCSCPIQRTLNGDLADGMAAHFRYVHPGESVPA